MSALLQNVATPNSRYGTHMRIATAKSLQRAPAEQLPFTRLLGAGVQAGFKAGRPHHPPYVLNSHVGYLREFAAARAN